jgi:hypothetical protein
MAFYKVNISNPATFADLVSAVIEVSVFAGAGLVQNAMVVPEGANSFASRASYLADTLFALVRAFYKQSRTI